ncbi:glycosyltransferase [Bacillus sp. SG-1]|uniref:glycosyltransferase n=1 Tax=Bacillus sp. SG-1 TaxID=161544 RepID=UPI0001543566|nr:glycosyltransferase [Bacillus sp. SG-1]EDL65257.1 putative lipopolysaccharide biosynthesis protein [Bacillus sp. SG-1]
MKVLHVINNLEFGGAENLLKELISIQVEEGIEVDLYLLERSGMKDGGVTLPGVKLLEAQASSRYSLTNLFFLRNIFHHYDIIHVHLFPSQFWVASAKFVSKKNPVLITTEHSTMNRRRNKKFFYLLDLFMYGQYNKIVCISEGTASGLIERYKSLEKKIEIIHNGIRSARFLEIDPVHIEGLTVKDPVILTVGRLEKEKNHEVIIKALKFTSNVHLLVAGDGKRKGELESLAINSGVSSRVHFLGERQDIPELMKMASIYIQPSKWEGFGLAVLEAMTSGLPVIASDIPGLREVVGSSGLLFDPENVQDLVKKIEDLLNDPGLIKELRLKSIERSKEFSVEKTAEQYLKLYEKLSKKKLH